MNDTSSALIVTRLLQRVLPTAKAEQVAQWAIERRILGEGKQIEERYRAARDDGKLDELADKLWRTYCERCGEDYVHEPDNLRVVLDLIAERLAYGDANAFQEHEPDRYSRAVTRLEQMEWRSHFLTRQHLRMDEKAKMVGKVLKDWRSADDEFRLFEAERKNARLQNARVEYTDAELFEVIGEKLESNPRRHYSYNQMWRELVLPQRQLMKVKDHLTKLADPASKIYTNVVRFKPKAVPGIQLPEVVYQWAPARRKLGERPTKARRDNVIKGVIYEYLKASPDKTTRDIVAHVRASLGSVGTQSVTSALTDLVEKTQEVVVAKGAHNASVHRLRELTDADVDFAVDLSSPVLCEPPTETAKPVAVVPSSVDSTCRESLAEIIVDLERRAGPQPQKQKVIDWSATDN